MTKKKDELSESLEDYLEVILQLEKTNKVARVKDIAVKMQVLRGTVTGALKSLAEKELINYEPYSYITLTPRGAAIARDITKRHGVLKNFLFKVLQIENERADAIACRMEHAMDKAAVERLVRFVEFIDQCPKTQQAWIDSFLEYCRTHEIDHDKCTTCIDRCLSRHQADHVKQA